MSLLQAIRFALAIQDARKRGRLLGVILLKSGHVDIAVLQRVGDVVFYRKGRQLLAWRMGTPFSLAGAQAVVAHEAAAACLDETAFKASGLQYASVEELEKLVNEHVTKYWDWMACPNCGTPEKGAKTCPKCGIKMLMLPTPQYRLRSLDDVAWALHEIEGWELPPLRLPLTPATLSTDVLAKVSRFTASELAALEVTSFAALSDQLEGARRSMSKLAGVNWRVLLAIMILLLVVALMLAILPHALQGFARLGGGVTMP